MTAMIETPDDDENLDNMNDGADDTDESVDPGSSAAADAGSAHSGTAPAPAGRSANIGHS